MPAERKGDRSIKIDSLARCESFRRHAAAFRVKGYVLIIDWQVSERRFSNSSSIELIMGS